ncbi:MAG: DUF4386 domain-containing protein [Gemmatimonadales bacterium]
MTDLRRTARATGLWYLGIALTGLIGFLLIRPAIHIPGSPAETARNLVEQATLARLGIALELGIVLTQAGAALWFYRLFRSVDAFAAGALVAFGLVNSVAILGSAAFMATALGVSADPGMAPGGDVAATVQLLYEVSGKLWSVAALFFGLWLIPMGWLARASGRMPAALGWTLMVGGVGYIVSGFLANGLAGVPSWLVEGLTIPASIGEFWMIGYLLSIGVRAEPASGGGLATAG